MTTFSVLRFFCLSVYILSSTCMPLSVLSFHSKKTIRTAHINLIKRSNMFNQPAPLVKRKKKKCRGNKTFNDLLYIGSGVVLTRLFVNLLLFQSHLALSSLCFKKWDCCSYCACPRVPALHLSTIGTCRLSHFLHFTIIFILKITLNFLPWIH